MYKLLLFWLIPTILVMSDDDMIKLGRAFAALGAKPEYTASELDQWLATQTAEGNGTGNPVKTESANVVKETVSVVNVNPRKLPPFSGDENKNDVKFAQWKFEAQCLLNDKSQSEELVFQSIRSSIKGTAADVLLHLGDKCKVSEVLDKFDVVFGDVLGSEQLLESFYSAKQNVNESVALWGCRLEDVLDKAKKQGGVTQDAVNSMLRSKFWSGITDVSLKSALRHHYDGGMLYEELFRHARTIEVELRQTQKVKCHQQSDPQTAKKSDCNPQLDQVLAELKKLGNRIDKLESKRTNSGKRQCFCCKSEDHLIKDCPNKTSKNE